MLRQIQSRFFIGYWIITGVDFHPAPFFFRHLATSFGIIQTYRILKN